MKLKSHFKFGLCLIAALLTSTMTFGAKQHGVAIHGEPALPADFSHFPYADPKAKKGGTIRLSTSGTFDSLHPFILKGTPSGAVGLIYQTLTVASLDEPATEYGYVAKSIELADDRTWVKFHLRPEAVFHDGHPITADDVVWTFNTLIKHGRPHYAAYYHDVTKVESENERTVKFTISNPNNRELPIILGQIAVLPEHYWKDRDFTKGTLDVPLGSGLYAIESVDPGKKITFKRVKDHWASDLPVMKGQFNFDRIEYDYYRDNTVLFEAFKSHEFDIFSETIAKRWATGYDFPAIKSGKVKRELIENQTNQGMQAFIINTRNPIFKDRAVRQALNVLFDFEWTNKNLFHGTYRRNYSYFTNSELAAKGLPSEAELKLLTRWKDDIPAEVFTTEYTNSVTDGSGSIRQQLREAVALLKSAGWELKNGVMTHSKTQQPLSFEFLAASEQPAFERIILPYIKNLKKAGIQASIRSVDTAQYIERRRNFEFDVTLGGFPQSESPGNEQRDYWSSRSADVKGSYNLVGIKNPAIDDLVEHIVKANNREELITATRALDRVLLWNYYVVPQWHLAANRLVWWDQFNRPATRPKYHHSYWTWWAK